MRTRGEHTKTRAPRLSQPFRSHSHSILTALYTFVTLFLIFIILKLKTNYEHCWAEADSFFISPRGGNEREGRGRDWQNKKDGTRPGERVELGLRALPYYACLTHNNLAPLRNPLEPTKGLNKGRRGGKARLHFKFLFFVFNQMLMSMILTMHQSMCEGESGMIIKINHLALPDRTHFGGERSTLLSNNSTHWGWVRGREGEARTKAKRYSIRPCGFGGQITCE